VSMKYSCLASLVNRSLDGTLRLFDNTTLFSGAQINGDGNLVLEEGSGLDMRGLSSIFISPRLQMRDNLKSHTVSARRNYYERFDR